MRIAISISLFLLSAIQTCAQHSVISTTTKQHTIYIGLQNTVEFAVENSTCKRFQLFSDDIKFEPTESPCVFFATPDNPGKFKVVIRDSKTNKVAFETKFNVVKLPPPAIRFASKNSGELPKAHAKAQVGLIASLDGFDLSTRFEVEKFIVIIVRNGEVVFSKKNIGAIFSPEVKEGLKGIQTGDKLIFADATYNGPVVRSGNLSPAEFVIVD